MHPYLLTTPKDNPIKAKKNPQKSSQPLAKEQQSG
jgi:hypothetical protein